MVCMRDGCARMLWARMSTSAARNSASETASKSVHDAGFDCSSCGSCGRLNVAASSESHV